MEFCGFLPFKCRLSRGVSSQEPNPFRYCGGCGQPSPENTRLHRFSCKKCGWVFYKSPAAATAAILELPDGRVVLTRRMLDPGAGALDMPGGFVDPGEAAEEAICRELHEELGLSVAPADLTPLFSLPNQYLFSGVLYWTVDFFFRVRITEIPKVGDPDEIGEVLALPPREVDPEKIAFSSIRRGLARYIESLG